MRLGVVRVIDRGLAYGLSIAGGPVSLGQAQHVHCLKEIGLSLRVVSVEDQRAHRQVHIQPMVVAEVDEVEM